MIFLRSDNDDSTESESESRQSLEELEMSITEMENTQEFKDVSKVLFYQIKKKQNTAISAKCLISLYANDTAAEDSSSALDNFVRN